MPEKFEGGVPPQERKEGKAEGGFFSISEQDVEMRYGEPALDYQRQRGIEKGYQTWELTQDLTKQFDALIEQNEGQIPDNFFQDILRLAREYKSLRIGHCEQYDRVDGALRFSQLFSLIRHPVFIKDKRSVAVMEELADLEHAEPWSFNMYTKHDEKKGYLLRDGFGPEHLPTFQQLIDNPKLWQGKSKEMRRVFFSSLAEAIEKMSADNPSETLPLRLKLLEYNGEYGNYGEIRYHIVDTFESDEDKAALEKILQDRPVSRIAQEAQRILSGGYKNSLWFI